MSDRRPTRTLATSDIALAIGFAAVLLLLITALPCQRAAAQPTPEPATEATAPIQPWSENPRYWSYHGQPIILLGGSDDDNLFQWPMEKLTGQLERIANAGGNVVRNTMSDRKDGGWEVYPFLQLENGKYDLKQFNPEYWQRFENFLRLTQEKQIFVQLEVWDRFDYTDQRANDPQRWEKHPYNPVNNINYTAEETGLQKRYPKHPGTNDQPFFYSTPEQKNILPLLQVQRRFVDKLLQHTLNYDHVLYCIDNETSGDPAWGKYWAMWIKQRAQQEDKTVYVTEMWDDWDLRSGQHRHTFDHPEIYDFVDVSQNNHNRGQKHWDNFLFVRDLLEKHPRPINTTKIYGADGNKFGHTDQDAIERFWRHLLGGAASVRFHRPASGLGINARAVACLKAARLLQKQVPIWSLQPADHLLGQREENECYAACSANENPIVLYFPAGEMRSVQLISQVPDTTIRWLNIDTGTAQEPTPLAGKTIQPPTGFGNAVAIIR